LGGGKPFGDGRNPRVILPKSYRGFDDKKPPDKRYFDEMFRVSKNQIIFGGNYFMEYLPSSPCWIVWDKDNGASYFADCELVWTSFKTAVRKVKFKWNGMLQGDMKNKEERVHPTQKPIQVMRWILEHYTTEAQSILDPFAGSGTTLVAAKELGRRATGIEKDEYYIEVAKQRLDQARVLNPLF
jgi:site-specific DNA-methyltransferase (adenine-specific)